MANSPIQEKINKAVPDNYRYNAQGRRHESEKIEVAEELLDCTEYTLKANQLVTSQKCLDLAVNLYGTPLPKRYLELKEQLNKKRKLLSRVLSEVAHKNITAASDALKNKQLKEALDYLHKIPVEEQQKPSVIKLKAQLDVEIKKAVKQGAAIGRKLYSDGKIKEALEIWQALLVLDPENAALQKHIARAERVLKKLESLGSSKALEK